MLSDKYKCMSINTFGLSGEEKVGPINCKIRYKFNNNDIFKEFINQDDDTFLLKYPYKSNKTVFLDSNTYITIDKNHNSPFDYSLIFKNQFVSSWSYLYEK